MRKRMFQALSVASLATFAVCLPACSAGFHIGDTHPEPVDSAKLAQQVKDQLGKKVGEQLGDAKCQGDLDAKAGAKQTCAVEDKGTWYSVAVNVTSVKDSRVNFQMQMGNPIPAPK